MYTYTASENFQEVILKALKVKALLEEHQGIAPGFDALRIIFCVVIIAWHSYTVTTGKTITGYPAINALLRSILPMFFFLSGFLVTGSALRLRSIRTFFLFRFFRIIPALVVEVTLSAIVIGGVVTTLAVGEYFQHPEFYAYFANIFGFVHLFLPGVFETHPTPFVNVNLWTLPPELKCYIITLVLMACGAIYDRRIFLVLFIAYTLCMLFMLPELNWGVQYSPNYKLLNVHGYSLIYCFSAGIACYLFGDKIPIRRDLMLVSFIGLGFLAVDYTVMIGLFFSFYFCLCMGFIDLRKISMRLKGDYSYGLYLYGYPIQQTLCYFFTDLRSPVALFVVALPTAFLFAALSWHLVEKPVLSLRKRFDKVKI